MGTDNAPHAIFLLMKMIEIKASIIMCPADMFAKRRIINANGFVNIPTISIGIMIGIKAMGTPGVAKICFQ